VLFRNRREVPKYNKDGSRAKKDAVQYLCNVCKAWTKSTGVAVDHIIPVIDIEVGFQGWDTFVKRLGFNQASNLQVICDPCHQIKTNGERFLRNLGQDWELLAVLEQEAMSNKGLNLESTKKRLTKFSNKKLARYPADFVARIEAIRRILPKGRKQAA